MFAFFTGIWHTQWVPPIETNVPLAPLTTLGLGGAARALIRVSSESELEEVFRSVTGPIRILGGGSNLVVPDEGVQDLVVKLEDRSVERQTRESESLFSLGAGVIWDDFVQDSVASGYCGIECLSGIPGTTGATPVQNVGAYGVEVADVFESLRAYDRQEHIFREFSRSECKFAYRHSLFKHNPRFVITQVTLRLAKGIGSVPLTYAELCKALGIAPEGRAPTKAVRDTVIGLRRSKGMVWDPTDSESRSAGSFFTNPIIPVEKANELTQAYPSMPTFSAAGGVKLSAGWLIEQSGFKKGTVRGGVGISQKHALALVNRGGTATELIALSKEIQKAVFDTFGVRLEPEPTFW